MTPLPKRKHSSMRVGKRKKAFFRTVKKATICKKCGKSKYSHFACPNCKNI